MQKIAHYFGYTHCTPLSRVCIGGTFNPVQKKKTHDGMMPVVGLHMLYIPYIIGRISINGRVNKHLKLKMPSMVAAECRNVLLFDVAVTPENLEAVLKIPLCESHAKPHFTGQTCD